MLKYRTVPLGIRPAVLLQRIASSSLAVSFFSLFFNPSRARHHLHSWLFFFLRILFSPFFYSLLLRGHVVVPLIAVVLLLQLSLSLTPQPLLLLPPLFFFDPLSARRGSSWFFVRSFFFFTSDRFLLLLTASCCESRNWRRWTYGDESAKGDKEFYAAEEGE